MSQYERMEILGYQDIYFIGTYDAKEARKAQINIIERNRS